MTSGVVRVGDKVRFQGRVHTVASLGWEHVTLLDDSLAPVAVLRGFLLGDSTFEVLGQQPASSRTVEPLAQLSLVHDAEVQRVRELERHLLEVYAPELAGEVRPDYDSELPVGTRERNKVRELAGLGMTVSLSTLRRWRALHNAEGLVGLLDRRQLPPHAADWAGRRPGCRGAQRGAEPTAGPFHWDARTGDRGGAATAR